MTTFTEIQIKDLPLYNHDYDADYPPQGRALKAAITSVDALLFVTPEYNRSIPGALNNAIDWGSRPWGDNSFTLEPSAGSDFLTSATSSAATGEVRPAPNRSAEQPSWRIERAARTVKSGARLLCRIRSRLEPLPDRHHAIAQRVLGDDASP